MKKKLKSAASLLMCIAMVLCMAACTVWLPEDGLPDVGGEVYFWRLGCIGQYGTYLLDGAG